MRHIEANPATTIGTAFVLFLGIHGEGRNSTIRIPTIDIQPKATQTISPEAVGFPLEETAYPQKNQQLMIPLATVEATPTKEAEPLVNPWKGH